MFSRIHASYFAALTLAAGLAVAPGIAAADGQPVVSLQMPQLDRRPAQTYSDRASPVVTLPVRRVTGSGEDTTIEYDTTAAPRPVVSAPVRGVTGSGEDVRILYDLEAGARQPHTVPSLVGVQDAARWNSLP